MPFSLGQPVASRLTAGAAECVAIQARQRAQLVEEPGVRLPSRRAPTAPVVAGTLAGTPLITIASGATLDTSALAAGLTLAPGQTLTGSGKLDGSLTVGSGATLSAAGASIGAITITNTLSFGVSGTNVVEVNAGASDVVNAGYISYGGTLVVNNLGPAERSCNEETE